MLQKAHRIQAVVTIFDTLFNWRNGRRQVFFLQKKSLVIRNMNLYTGCFTIVETKRLGTNPGF